MICQGWRHNLYIVLAVSAALAGCRSAAPEYGQPSAHESHVAGQQNTASVKPATDTSVSQIVARRAALAADQIPSEIASGGIAIGDRAVADVAPGGDARSAQLSTASYQSRVNDQSRDEELPRVNDQSRDEELPRVNDQSRDEELPLPNSLAPQGSPELPDDEPELLAPPTPVELRAIIVSVQSAYPLLLSAMQQRTVASGKQLSALGEFDLRAKAFGVAAPEGFYQTYRNGVSLDQPLATGGYVYGGYKIGDGNFQPWFKERETDEGGEFSVGFGTPLLKGRVIDKRRAELFQADLARQAVEPAVRALLLEFVRVASLSYWDWVAAGQALRAQRELLENAQDRVEQIEERVDAGDLARIARINNQQLIAARETKVIESERKLQKAAIKLSLYYRDAQGDPVVPANSQLPAAFPDHATPNADAMASDIALAIEASPVLAELRLIVEQVRVELKNAENMLLPKLDARALASKDVGLPASAKRDKTPFELEAGLFGEVPLQRREARGKIHAAQGKLAQLNAKRQYVLDKTVAAVQDATSALVAAASRIDRADTNVRLARETLQLGRLQFEAGDIDLVALNIYEKAVTDAEFLLIAAESDYFKSLANYRAALAADPLAP